MDAGQDTEQDRAALLVRALMLQKLSDCARVFTGTLAELRLERGRADIGEAIGEIERGGTPLRPIAERLQNIAISIGSALYMSGIDGADGTSVKELSAKLAAWCGDSSGA
jgi:hypothetical protein